MEVTSVLYVWSSLPSSVRHTKEDWPQPCHPLPPPVRALLAFVPRDLLAVWPGLGRAVGGALHDAVEGVGHPGVRDGLGLVVPQLLLGLALDVRHDELDILGNQFTFLPGDGLAGVGTGPNLGILLRYRFIKKSLTCLPSASVSQRVTQFCLVTFLHSGSSLVCGIVFLPWVHPCSVNFLAASLVSVNCCGTWPDLHSL